MIEKEQKDRNIEEAPHIMRYPNNTKEIDYSEFDERFVNKPEPIGHEFTKLEALRESQIKQLAQEYKTAELPKTFGSLDPMKIGKTPSTRLWYRRVSSYERNGFFNIFTIKLGVKVKYWFLYPFLIYGMTSFVHGGIYYDEYDFSRIDDVCVYDKMAMRRLPSFRIWNRPG